MTGGAHLLCRERSKRADSKPLPKWIAYGLPGKRRSSGAIWLRHEDFELLDAPIPYSLSFLDHDGVIVFAGAFEELDKTIVPRRICCPHPADLDRRLRESCTLLKDGKPLVFLLSDLPVSEPFFEVDADGDLFRRIAQFVGLDWERVNPPTPIDEVHANEFSAYARRYANGYLRLLPNSDISGNMVPLIGGPGRLFGAVFASKLFFVPCTYPQTHEDILDAAKSAISAILAYRQRLSEEMPDWSNDFVFGHEADLRNRLSELRHQTLQVETSIDTYTRFKGALCYQSDPLVRVVRDVLSHFFGITLLVDDKCIEDATLMDENEQVFAVFEIKGVKGSFTRQNVNQLDSHRERLGVPSTTPGILIMNTVMSATSIEAKDQPPHPDIIKKAVSDNVLLIRTLDLLRYADAVERGVLSREEFTTVLLNESGWLKIDSDTIEVVKG